MNCFARWCRRRGKYHGRWAGGGGLCLHHAAECAAQYGLEQFHAEDRSRLEKDMSKAQRDLCRKDES